MDVKAIEQFVAQGDTEAALQSLLQLTTDTAWEKEALMLNSNFQAIRRDQRLGLTNESDDRQKVSKINYSILEVLDALEQNVQTTPRKGSHRTPLHKRLLPVVGVLLLLLGVGYFLYTRTQQPGENYYFQYKANGLPKDLVTKIDSLQKAQQSIKSVAFGPNDEWAILYGRNKYLQNGNLAASIQAELEDWRKRDVEFRGLVIGKGADFFLWFDKNNFRHPLHPQNFPAGLLDSLYLYNQQMREIKDVAIGPDNSWVILWNDKGCTWQHVPKALEQQLKQAIQTNVPFKKITISRNGGWVLLYGTNVYSYGYVDEKLIKTLDELSKKEKELLQVYIKDEKEWIVIYK